MTPDDIKREAEEIADTVTSSSCSDRTCLACTSARRRLENSISQALLSSRDQGYQEGVEDAVKAVEEACLCREMLGYEECRIPCHTLALSSLKDKLKPKEKV